MSIFKFFAIIVINFNALKIDFFKSKDEIYQGGKTQNGDVLWPHMWRRFTPPVAIFDYAEFILRVGAIDQK